LPQPERSVPGPRRRLDAPHHVGGPGRGSREPGDPGPLREPGTGRAAPRGRRRRRARGRRAAYGAGYPPGTHPLLPRDRDLAPLDRPAPATSGMVALLVRALGLLLCALTLFEVNYPGLMPHSLLATFAMLG